MSAFIFEIIAPMKLRRIAAGSQKKGRSRKTAGASRRSSALEDGAEALDAADYDAESGGCPPLRKDETRELMLDDCPVIPLGQNGDFYYFMSPSGQCRSCKYKDLSANLFLSLFDGDQVWLYKHFVVMKDGVASGELSVARIKSFFVSCCAKVGIFDPATPLRGPGVWKSDSGSLIVHVGDAIQVEGAWRAPGLVEAKAIYAAAPKTLRPSIEIATAEEGRSVQNLLNLWSYAEPDAAEQRVRSGEVSAAGADLILGFIGSAMLGGATRWRAHILVGAEHGSGKTTLIELVHALFGGGAHPPTNDFSSAGIRQWLTHQARALLLDEAESGEDADLRIRQVVSLLRQMSQGEGAHVVRGGADGHDKHYAVTGSVYLTAILPPVLKAQDKSRITPIQLSKLETGEHAIEKAANVVAAIKQATKLGPRLRARAIDGYLRYLDTWQIYRSAFMVGGKLPRNADQIATLLAGRDLLIFDGLPDSDSVDMDVKRFSGFAADPSEAEDDGEGPRALNRLVTAAMESWTGGDRRTIGGEILVARTDTGEGAGARSRLERYGLKIVCHADEPGRHRFDKDQTAHWLFVANDHHALTRIYDGTGWARGGWQAALRYLRGARPDAQWIEGTKSRGTLVPWEFLPWSEPDSSSDETGAVGPKASP